IRTENQANKLLPLFQDKWNMKVVSIECVLSEKTAFKRMGFRGRNGETSKIIRQRFSVYNKSTRHGIKKVQSKVPHTKVQTGRWKQPRRVNAALEFLHEQGLLVKQL
ncbi:MAG: hypothetical protein FWC83_01085, partial [Alphaproteobacteria bacterium]|nr:hypothetical protein [Alphaproteobacteria bacterium]